MDKKWRPFDQETLDNLRSRADAKLRYAEVHLEELKILDSTSGSDTARAHQESFLFHLFGSKDALWHALRHTLASRLVAAGVDLRTVQELGGWKTLSMVQRYAHLSPNHLATAVEKIVAVPATVISEAVNVREHRQNFDSVESASRERGVRH